MDVIIPTLCSAGYFNGALAYAGFTRTQEHEISQYQIEFCTEDCGTTYIDGIPYPIVKNRIFCAKPGQKRWTQLPFRCYYLHFIPSDGRINQLLADLPVCFSVPEEKMQSFVQQIGKLLTLRRTAKQHIPEKELQFYSELLSFLSQLHQESRRFHEEETQNVSAHNMQAITQAIAYLEENYSQKCTLEELAQSANFSPIYFHKLFKSIIGQSPAEYLLQFRITKAQELLAATDLPLCDIALQCGFTSQSYFNYVFRREKQCTPAEYRKRQIQKYFKE